MKRHKIASIVGARPQFIKAAAVSRAFRLNHPESAEEILIHTGQHYDENMSKVFFDEMEIPEPKFNLEVGSGSHGYMLAEIIKRTEAVLMKEQPDMAIVYGDTNSTLGGALAAAKLDIPVAHVEAGLRSFNKSMPEEVNRILVDHISTLLFSPTLNGVQNLRREGFHTDAAPPFNPDNPKVFHCGDVMYDTALYFKEKAEKSSMITEKLKLRGKDFALCTIHRNNNTDDPQRLTAILKALAQIIPEFKMPIVFPVHPRTAKMLAALPDREFVSQLFNDPFFIRIEPVGYLDMLLLESHARLILTDSGGVQKEAFFFRKPCIVLRAETEWTELIDLHAATLGNADGKLILNAFQEFYEHPPVHFPAIYGDGEAAGFICREIMDFLNNL